MPEIKDVYIHIPIRDSSLFRKDSFRTITIKKEDGIIAVIGKLKSVKKDSIVLQKYMFKVDDGWTLEAATNWVEKYNEEDSKKVYEIYD
jgi:hypothetical protein